jgi:hypothetical protein
MTASTAKALLLGGVTAPAPATYYIDESSSGTDVLESQSLLLAQQFSL